jgi:hypothetical protein
MFQQLTTLLTLLAMLGHASLGCRWHHAHGVEQAWRCAERATGMGAASCGHSHDSHHPSSAAGDDQREAPGHPSTPLCLEGECKYLRNAEPQRLHAAGAEQPASLFDLASLSAANLLSCVRDDALCEAALCALPYAPRCETTQVWLI